MWVFPSHVQERISHAKFPRKQHEKREKTKYAKYDEKREKTIRV